MDLSQRTGFYPYSRAPNSLPIYRRSPVWICMLLEDPIKSPLSFCLSAHSNFNGFCEN